jgi:thioredoxin-like negative regulator of GroEL
MSSTRPSPPVREDRPWPKDLLLLLVVLLGFGAWWTRSGDSPTTQARRPPQGRPSEGRSPQLAVAPAEVTASCPLARPAAIPGVQGEVPPRWLDGAAGFAEAVEHQRTSRAPLLLYFYTDWCGYCRQVERDVFSLAEFDATFGRSAIRVRVNPEASQEDRRLGDRFGVSGYPSFFVMPPGLTDGIRCSLFGEAEGGRRQEAFSPVELRRQIDDQTLQYARRLIRSGFDLREAGDLAGAARALDRAVLAAPDEPEAWLHRGIVRQKLGLLDDALSDYARVAALRSDGLAHDHAVHLLLGSRRFDDAVACATDWLERAPDDVRALRQRSRAHRGRQDLVRAREDRAQACALGDQASCAVGSKEG